jgi:LacI family transcriptional regulator
MAVIKLKDIAKLANVSVTTASYALNNRPEVSEETKKRVLDIARKYNYKPSGIARDLKMKKTETIGLILSNLAGPFYAEIINGIEEITFSNGYNLVVCSSYGGKNSTAVRYLKEKRTDGILLLTSDIEDEIILESANHNFPIVLLDRELKGDYIWSATVDNEKGAYKAVEHLIKLGYTNIGYFSGPNISLDNKQRYEGYKKALDTNRLKLKNEWVVHGQFTRSGGYRAAQALIAKKSFPEAIFCANDEMAIGAIEAFRDAGIKVPDQIAIVGFDDIELASYITPSLTTVKHPKYLLGSTATHMLIQALKNDFNISNIKLDTQLIIRESCGSKIRGKEV